jgi:tRNA pseudouridine synthase 10
VKSSFDPISNMLKNYDLCEYCTGRMISKSVGKSPSKFLGKKYIKKFTKYPNKKCYICKNVFDRLDTTLSSILEKSSNHNFQTYNLGILVKPSFLERDDYLKSKYKFKGIENIKFGIAMELAKKISKRTNSKRITADPDLFIQVNFKDESCTLRAKPMFVYGRYNKKIRKLPQKQELCISCNGIGCHNCNFKGKENVVSIEGKISNFFINKFNANQVKINWIGGEDRSSLVLGNGRPFFAKILNPKNRNQILRKSFDLNGVSLSELKKLSLQPKGTISFKSEVSITIYTKKPISSNQLKKLKTLENTRINDVSKDKKNTQKQIYKLNYKKLKKNSFILDLIVDGGISIKSFIQNSDVTPNVSKLLENQCKCMKFDFKNIIV